jgi:hypothetical protein
MTLKIAMFYASWEKFGEKWATPVGVKWELESRGIEVTHYNLYHADGELLPRKNVRTYSGDCFNRFSVDFKQGYKPDAVLVLDYGVYDYVGMDRRFYPGVPFILEAGDTPQSFRMHAQKANKFDAVVTPDFQSTELFNRMGVQAHWMSHWADHRIFHPNYDIESQFDCVSTCGGRRVTEEMQRELGERFNNERYFYGEDHAKRLMMGKIVLQCSQFGEITRRIFEGMAVGRMVLTDRLSVDTHIGDIFTEDEDIVYYNDAKDAIEKINFYIDNPVERSRIAANGYNKVIRNHTVKNRVDHFVDIINKLKE